MEMEWCLRPDLDKGPRSAMGTGTSLGGGVAPPLAPPSREKELSLVRGAIWAARLAEEVLPSRERFVIPVRCVRGCIRG